MGPHEGHDARALPAAHDPRGAGHDLRDQSALGARPRAGRQSVLRAAGHARRRPQEGRGALPRGAAGRPALHRASHRPGSAARRRRPGRRRPPRARARGQRDGPDERCRLDDEGSATSPHTARRTARPEGDISAVARRLRRTRRAWTPTALSVVADDSRDPFRVLIACILSLRTQDSTTGPASERLFALADTPERMLTLTPRAIARAIYPVGF